MIDRRTRTRFVRCWSFFGRTKSGASIKRRGPPDWNNVKFIDEDTGFTDLVMDMSDPKTLYAASYQRRRTSWGFNGGGPGSGIWKTTDAGKTWAKLQGSGLPEGLLGRIGLDLGRSNSNVLYAQMEVGASSGTGCEEQTPGAATPTPTPSPARLRLAHPLRIQAIGVWRSDDSKSWRIVSNENNRPMYYSQIRVESFEPGKCLRWWLEL